jgi:hypothetical protein
MPAGSHGRFWPRLRRVSLRAWEIVSVKSLSARIRAMRRRKNGRKRTADWLLSVNGRVITPGGVLTVAEARARYPDAQISEVEGALDDED